MPVASIQTSAKVNPADIPLEKITSSKVLSEEQKTAEMTRQFESMLLRQILTEAHKPVFKSKFAQTGVTSAIYQDMTVTQLADKISSARTLGLAQELQKQFENGSAKAAPKTETNSETKPAPALPPIPKTKTPRL